MILFACVVQELEQQTREVLAGQPVTKNIFKHQARDTRFGFGLQRSGRTGHQCGGADDSTPHLCLDV